jgi:hypothetical protein
VGIRVIPVPVILQVTQDTLDRETSLDTQATPDQVPLLVILDIPVTPVTQDTLDRETLLGTLGILDPLEAPEALERLDIQATRAILVLAISLVIQDTLEQLGIRGIWDRETLPATQVTQAIPATRDLATSLATLGILDTPVSEILLVIRGILVLKELVR